MPHVPTTVPGVPRRALVASAVVVNRESINERRGQTLDWQDEAFSRTKTIPELNYASRFYARMLTRLRIYPATRDEQDRTKPIESGLPVELLDRIQDPGGGRSQLLASYGRLMFIAGEGYLFGRDLDKDTERWSFVSGKEVEQTEDGEILWRPYQTGEPKRFRAGEQGVLYRMWTPDPEKSGEPESPMRSVLEIAEELSILTKAVRATAVSRMLQGLLKVPQEISFGAETPGKEGDPEEIAVLRAIIDHITGIVENAGTPEAASPLIIEGAAEFLKALEWVEMHNPEKDYMEKDLRMEAIRRAALGLDMPAELLLGLADANHWGARQIMHAAWQSHGSSIAEQFCDDLCEAYLRPALRREDFEDWRSVVIAYDDANVVVSPDRSEDAHKGFANLAFGWEGYRKLIGASEEHKPSDEEFKILLALRMREASFLQGTKYEVPSVVPGERGPLPDPSTNGRDPEESPPDPGPSGVSRRESRSLAMRGAAEMAILRCRALAGSRLRTRHRKVGGFEDMWKDTANAQLAACLGQETLTELKSPDPLVLVKDGSADFVDLCMQWGINEAQATSMGQQIEVYASKTLFEPGLPDFPAGLAAAIERANETSTELEIVERNNEALERLRRMVPGGESLAVPPGEKG